MLEKKIDSTIIDQLKKYDTPTICNVLELFPNQIRTSGYTDKRLQACYPKLPPMVGYAFTASFRSASPPRQGDVYSGLQQQVEWMEKNKGPHVIVFQDLDEPSVAATFGEIMCTTYQKFGAVGLITSGTGRDLDQVEALQFPCFTQGTICSHGYCQIIDIQIPVRVAGLTIHPGDLLHGDRNGVARIPIEQIEDVVLGCQEYMAAEGIVLDYLRQGKVTASGYQQARDGCHEAIKKIATRLQSKYSGK